MPVANPKRIKKGKVLLAQPFSADSHFKRTALLLTEHHDEGSVGFILNKPMDFQVEDLLNDFPEFAAQVYFGGPVATDSLHFIHNVGDLLEGSVMVKRGIYWGGDFSKLKFLIESKLISKSNIRFYIGYSGWSAGQLNAELKEGSWVVAEMHNNYLFKAKSEQLWEEIMTNQGNAYSVLAKLPDNVNWN